MESISRRLQVFYCSHAFKCRRTEDSSTFVEFTGVTCPVRLTLYFGHFLSGDPSRRTYFVAPPPDFFVLCPPTD